MGFRAVSPSHLVVASLLSGRPNGPGRLDLPPAMTNDLGLGKDAQLSSTRRAMSDPIILIPARLAATRLPNKPLADIGGEPMIVHVWRRAVEAGIGPVAVATDSREIADAVARAGGRGGHDAGGSRFWLRPHLRSCGKARP